jgi:hypothetical protein
MARMVMRIRGNGVRQLERDFMIRSDERDLNATIIRPGMKELGEDAVYALQNTAPFRTGRLSDNITAQPLKSITRPGVDIMVDAVNDQGFDYVNATRFGRRAVHAKRSRPGFRPDAGSGSARLARNPDAAIAAGQKRPFRRMALAFVPGPPGSAPMYRHSVRAWRPPGGDWVRKAMPEVDALTEKEFRRIEEWIEHYTNMSIPGSPPVKPHVFSVRRTSRAGSLRSG